MFTIFAVNNCSILLYMPRLKRIRKVLNPPLIKGFKPYGPDTPAKQNEPVVLLYEEYEALRLCDYDQLNHVDAAEIMNVSRPTFTRIYASLRRKLAQAFVEGRPMSIEGGKVYFDSDWHYCKSCGCHFNNPQKDITVETCALCGSSDIENYKSEDSTEPMVNGSCDEYCVCPSCGEIVGHIPGKPCNEMY